MFKVDLQLGEHDTIDEALAAWSTEVGKLREVGSENKADKLAAKLERLRNLC